MKTLATGKTLKTRLLNGLGRVLSLSAFLFLGGAAWPGLMRAEVPVKFTYQGNLRQSGFLVNGNRDMKFRIYDSSDPLHSTELCPVLEFSDVSVSTGVFRVTLEPVLSDWQSGNLWLELEIEGNRMSPREEITSSPYAINSLMVSGKRYTSAASAPTAFAVGDLWMDTVTTTLKFWNGTVWMLTSGTGLPGLHAMTHSGLGSDPIVSLGTHTVDGAMTLNGVLNPASNLLVGGGGYSVVFASSVSAGWYSGDGSGLTNLNASEITHGSLSGDRIGEVLVSSHIVDGSIQNQDLADGSIARTKFNQSGCANGQVLKWDNGLVQWICADDSFSGSGSEIDPISIHNQDTLQANTTFYVSSGTVNDLNVGNTLSVAGSAVIKGAPGQQGLSVEATGNVGIGVAGAASRLEIKGVDTQNYSLAVGTGTAHQVVVSTSGAVGIGTETPRAKLDVGGAEDSGQYIVIFNSGEKMAAWLRNK